MQGIRDPSLEEHRGGSYLEPPRPAFMGNLFWIKTKLSGRACLTGQQDHHLSPGSHHCSPQEADKVHAAPHPSLWGSLRGVCALPRAHRCGHPAVLRAGPRLLPGTDWERWEAKAPSTLPVPSQDHTRRPWDALLELCTLLGEDCVPGTPQTPGTKHKGYGSVNNLP